MKTSTAIPHFLIYQQLSQVITFERFHVTMLMAIVIIQHIFIDGTRLFAD